MRLLGFLLCLVAVPLLAERDQPDPLEQPWEEIVARASRDKRCIYLAFLGENWSVASKRFETHILESDAFQEFASRSLLQISVRARAHPKMSKERTARLQALVIHFDIKAYPTLILIAPDGREILRHGYREYDPAEYVRLLQAVLPATGEPEQSTPY